jgi:recombinational DNA repair protein (RecF pathway)
MQSQFAVLSDFAAACALDFFAEVSEQLLPAAEPSEKYFRLLTTVLEHLRSGEPGAVWRAVTYFSVWTVRLAGFLPELHVCLGCGSWLEDPEHPQRAYFSRHRAGLTVTIAAARSTSAARGNSTATPAPSPRKFCA